MKEQLTLQKILIEKFEEIRSKNPQFSRRAFAKRLNLSAGAMSELFNGHRKVSLSLMQKLSDKLMLDPQERAELLPLAYEKKNTAEDRIDPTYLRLSADQFNFIGDWYHFAILTLMRTPDFKSSRQWIAKRLGLPISTVKLAIERLKRIELVREDKNGKLTRTKVRYRTTDDVANISIRKAHFQYLENAKKSLDLHFPS